MSYKNKIKMFSRPYDKVDTINLPCVTISLGSIFRFSRGEGFLLGSWPSRNGVLALIMGGRRSFSVEVLIELVTKIELMKKFSSSHEAGYGSFLRG